ncbi:MAG: tetratricopeptide repeat protein [Candidatus Gastranaerophilaceae bacterium]|nr:tetratricopeptide repeat protein [Candidatus Gastranaerophilaceae bacterium]
MAENEEILSYIKRAFELKEQECYKQAIEMLYKAIALEPDNTEILFQIGELYYMLNNYTRAIQYPEQVLEQDGNHIPSLKLLKNICLKQNELYRAKETAEKIYELEKTDENLSSLIDIYGKLDLFEEIEQYTSEIERSELCLLAYAKTCYYALKIDKAETITDKALCINPENEDLLVLKGKILFDKNEPEKAKAIFSKFDKNTTNPEVLNYLGLFATDELNFIEAIKYFSKAGNLDKNNPRYLFNLGNAYYLNGWYEESVAAYQKAILLAPENCEYRYAIAYAYYEHNSFDKAKKEVDYILLNNNTHAGAKVLRALLMFHDKNFIEAENILKSNIASGSNDNFTLSSIAKIEAELGKYENAENHIKEILKRTNHNLSYKYDLGEIYIREKKYTEAISIANEILEENPNYIDGYILGAKAAYNNNNLDEAKKYAQEALSTDINCDGGYYYLAMVRKNEGDYEEAVECMKRAIMYNVNNAEYYAEMADIYRLSGDNKTAFEYIKEAENIDSSEEYKQLFRQYAAMNRK